MTKERCQRVVGDDGALCPNPVEWIGNLRVSRSIFLIKTCDLHRSALIDAEPIDGNWEWRRFPGPSDVMQRVE